MKKTKITACVLALSMLAPCAVGQPAFAEQTESGSVYAAERLDRGLAAVKTADGVYLSWRLYENEDNRFGTASENVTFNIYRDGVKIASEANTTNYIDKDGTLSAEYSVAPVINGEEGERCGARTAFASGGNYFDIPIVKPADETITDSEGNSVIYSFSPADCSCGDLDGDGEYEIVVKWTSNECDVGNPAYSGTVRFAAYKMDGTRLWDNDINLGKNVFSSAHTAQFLVYDFDGDGKAEMTVQTAPGSTDAKGRYVSQASKDTEINPYYIKSIDKNKLTVVMKNTTPVIYAADYDDSGELAAIKIFKDYKAGENELTADFDIDKAFIWSDVNPVNCADAENENADFREANNGRITSGDEYLTVFDGETGEAVDTISYPTKRVSVTSFGKKDGGNRSQRFLADVAYLDGVKPYAVYWRGYYDRGTGRTGIAGVSFDGERLSVDYRFDTYKNQPGYADGANELYTGQGNHSMIAADVDGDGKDEIISGALCMEASDDAISGGAAKQLKVKWCTFREHGDAHHIGDYDPTNDGLEYFTVHEHGGSDVTTDTGETLTLDYGMTVTSAKDGTELFHVSNTKDTGRGMMANIGAGGFYQITGAGTYIANGGTDFESANLGMSNNFRIFWDGDLYDELLNGTSITSWNGSGMNSIFNADGCNAINGTKANPSLQADLFGDWREEVIYPTTDGNKLRVFMTNIKTDYKMKTLMSDRLYRNGVAAEQTTYNQPPHISYYLSDEVFYGTLSGIDVDTSAAKTSYYVGEPFDKTGIKVTAHYSDNNDREAVNYSVNGYDPMKTGEQTVTVKYLGFEKSLTVNVVGESKIETAPSKTVYAVGEELDKTQLGVSLVYEDGSKAEVSGFKASGFDSMRLGEQTLTVTYTGVQGTYTANVLVTVASGLEIDADGTVTGFSGGENEITVPLYNGDTPVTAIADGAFTDSAAEKIYIYSEDIMLDGSNIFPAGVTLVCYEGSTAQTYAAEHNISVEIMTKGDAVTFDEDFYASYSGKNMLMQSDKEAQLKDEFVTYNTHKAETYAPWYSADAYGFAVKTDDNGNYLSVNAGIYDDMNKFNQVYMTLNNPKAAAEKQTVSFDVMFPSNSGTPYIELQDDAGTVIDTVSALGYGMSNDVWYRYELEYDGSSYTARLYDNNGAQLGESKTIGSAGGEKVLSSIAFKQGYNWGQSVLTGIVSIDNILLN